MRLIIIFCILSFIPYRIAFGQYVYPKSELRGAWIATVGNIDWPSSNKDSTAGQIEELKKIFDRLCAAGINTVFFQVRTECDALYDSPYEPWSYWLTGRQGEAPSPYFDPLKIAIEEAHSRGMDIQAWINPLRVMKSDDNFTPAKNNIMYTHPEWILKFGRYKMLNPGIPAVRHYVAKIAGDIARRYNVDGIHMDDYFYPYTPRIGRQDRSAFKSYNDGIKNIGDWRRNNINRLVKDVHDSVKAASPKAEFGISPFGIIRNRYAGTDGFEAYDVLYCDPLTWIKDRSVDYLIPQLYWEIGNPAADYRNLLLWWASVTDGVQLYIGNYSTSMASPHYKGDPDELEKQLKINRQIIRVVGTVYYSAKSIFKNYSGFADSLKKYFKYPSLVPAMTRIDSLPPLPPANITAADTGGQIILHWDKPAAAADGDTAFLFVVYRFGPGRNADLENTESILEIVPGNKSEITDTTDNRNSGQYIYAVTSVDHFGNESKPSLFKIVLK